MNRLRTLLVTSGLAFSSVLVLAPAAHALPIGPGGVGQPGGVVTIPPTIPPPSTTTTTRPHLNPCQVIDCSHIPPVKVDPCQFEPCPPAPTTTTTTAPPAPTTTTTPSDPTTTRPTTPDPTIVVVDHAVERPVVANPTFTG